MDIVIAKDLVLHLVMLMIGIVVLWSIHKDIQKRSKEDDNEKND